MGHLPLGLGALTHSNLLRNMHKHTSFASSTASTSARDTMSAPSQRQFCDSTVYGTSAEEVVAAIGQWMRNVNACDSANALAYYRLCASRAIITPTVHLVMRSIALTISTRPTMLCRMAGGDDACWADLAHQLGHRVLRVSGAQNGAMALLDQKRHRLVIGGHLLQSSRAPLQAILGTTEAGPSVSDMASHFSALWSDSLYIVDNYDVLSAAAPLGISGDAGLGLWTFIHRLLEKNAVQWQAGCEFAAPVYFFDQGTARWYLLRCNPAQGQNVGRLAWFPIDIVPTPSGTWTGIGSPRLSAAGRRAIDALSTTTICIS